MADVLYAYVFLVLSLSLFVRPRWALFFLFYFKTDKWIEREKEN